MTSIRCISRADILPFEVSDAARSEEEIKEAEAAGELKARVSQDVRLNGRYIDLRTAANQAIFKVQSGVCQVHWDHVQLMHSLHTLLHTVAEVQPQITHCIDSYIFKHARGPMTTS